MHYKPTWINLSKIIKVREIHLGVRNAMLQVIGNKICGNKERAQLQRVYHYNVSKGKLWKCLVR